MRIRFWGTRGSLAKPGPSTVRYGGNTSCVEVRAADGTLIILDCGTGAHDLGRSLVASGERWNGSELHAALEAEGLSFGPYSIFHREREDGKSLLYVASMMEPGSFDIERMDEQDFPGVSLFGVVPGPLDAPATFDLVLSVGRSLAERMKGQLQDEQGSTLTAQRILNLREELVHFEHRNRRLRRN